MILDYSRRAERDLETITDWIATDDPVRAVTFVAEMRAACGRLIEYPLAFPAVAERPARTGIFTANI